MNLIVKIPTTNAIKNASASPSQLTEIVSLKTTSLTISKSSDPNTIGRLIRKENFAQSSLFPPASRPADMVVPDRERPGKIARP